MSAAHLRKDRGRFGFRAERRGTGFKSVIRTAATHLVKEVMPFTKRVEQVGEFPDLHVRGYSELIEPCVVLVRIICAERSVRTISGQNRGRQSLCGDCLVILKRLRGIVRRAEHTDAEFPENPLRCE